MTLEPAPKKDFWLIKNIDEMTELEWESLCDGCGKCCTYQLEDEESLGSYYTTNVVCRYLDREKCHCTSYENRQQLVPDCMKITPENIATLDWLPKTCGYKLVYENKDLPKWHHLKTNNRNSVHEAGASVSGRCIADDEAGDLEDHIVYWKNF